MPESSPYDVVAPAYDTLTAGHAHDRWLADIERVALAHGLRGRRVLDVACGTGKSFAPLLRRGYDVTACDASAAMVARARIGFRPRRCSSPTCGAFRASARST